MVSIDSLDIHRRRDDADIGRRAGARNTGACSDATAGRTNRWLARRLLHSNRPTATTACRFGFVSQVDGRFFINDSTKTLTDTFVLRKFRPTFTGRVGRYFDFKMMPDLGNGQTVLADAYFGHSLLSEIPHPDGKR